MDSTEEKKKKKKKSVGEWILVVLNCLALIISITTAPWTPRFNFVHGVHSKWLSIWLRMVGWPLLILPIWISWYTKKQAASDSDSDTDTDSHVSPTLCVACITIGALTTLCRFFNAWGLASLRASPSSVFLTSELAQNAMFGFFLAGKKFTPYSINTIFLATVSKFVLFFNTSSARHYWVPTTIYWSAFVLKMASAAVYGLILFIIVFTYKKTSLKITYMMVMETHLIISFVATVLLTICMLLSGAFQSIRQDVLASGFGMSDLCIVFVWNAICWEMFYIGLYGVFFLTSSLSCSVIIFVLIPANELLGVLLNNHQLNPPKAVALAMAWWGLATYLYGERIDSEIANKPVVPIQESLLELAAVN